jgi:hypothetical protein
MQNQLQRCLLVSLTLAASTPLVAATTVLFGGEISEGAAGMRTVRPVSAPYFHEDSFVNSDIRVWYLRHDISKDTIGGDVSVAAVQVRLALTPTLQFVAYKDGYTTFDDDTALLGGNDGLNDIAAGLKWAFLQDDTTATYMAAGIGIELPLGDEDILQDTTEFRLWLSFNKGLGDLNLGGTLNYIIAEDSSDGLLGNADMLTLHLHADYPFTDALSGIVEVNGYFVTDGSAVPFSGVDAVSIDGGEDEDTLTGAVGLEFRPGMESLGLRIAYERELGSNLNLFGSRWTLSAVFGF